jgi:integrase
VTRKPKHKAAKTTVGQLQSSTARLKLAARTRPYFVKVASGAWVGYRKPLSGPGSWAARVAVGDGKGWEKTLWGADDNGLKPDGDKVLTFWQAKAKVQELAGKRPGPEHHAAPDSGDTMLTLDEALILYKRTLSERGAGAYNANRPRHHLGDKLLSKPCAMISEGELKDFRTSMLENGSAPSSANRVMNAVRAALTIACPDLTQRWRTGLKALPDATEANNVVIDDPAQVRQFVQEAYQHDGALGLLAHCLGETGARPGQTVRLLIRDLIDDPATPRLAVPRSGKGGTRHPGQRKIERYVVSISLELAAKLKAAAKGRPGNAPLLVRTDGKAWCHDPSRDYRRDVRAVMERIGLDPDVYTMYCLRHTSITRMLLAHVHTGIVAKAHDTSEAMIRKHYAASILDFTDKITRETLPLLGPMEPPPASNVVKLKKR